MLLVNLFAYFARVNFCTFLVPLYMILYGMNTYKQYKETHFTQISVHLVHLASQRTGLASKIHITTLQET